MLETLGWIPSTANKHKEITEMKVKVLEMLELCYGDLILYKLQYYQYLFTFRYWTVRMFPILLTKGLLIFKS